MKLTEKQWNLINDIALKIHTIDDINEMRKLFMYILNALVSYDSASFYVEEKSNHFGSPIGINLSKDELDEYIDEFAKTDPFIPLMDIFLESPSVIRTSDYAITTDIEHSEYYKKVWEPKNIRYAMFMPFSVNKEYLGSVSLFRNNDKEDFSEEDIAVLSIVKQHMQARLWREKVHEDKLAVLKKNEIHNHLNVNELSKKYLLTEREIEVINLWIQGYKDEEICEQIYISKNTLKKHISNIFHKLSIKNRVELLKLIDNNNPEEVSVRK